MANENAPNATPPVPTGEEGEAFNRSMGPKVFRRLRADKQRRLFRKRTGLPRRATLFRRAVRPAEPAPSARGEPGELYREVHPANQHAYREGQEDYRSGNYDRRYDLDEKNAAHDRGMQDAMTAQRAAAADERGTA